MKVGDHDLNCIGNPELLKLKKITFLRSRKKPANSALKSYDWAINQRNKTM